MVYFWIIEVWFTSLTSLVVVTLLPQVTLDVVSDQQWMVAIKTQSFRNQKEKERKKKKTPTQSHIRCWISAEKECLSINVKISLVNIYSFTSRLFLWKPFCLSSQQPHNIRQLLKSKECLILSKTTYKSRLFYSIYTEYWPS